MVGEYSSWNFKSQTDETCSSQRDEVAKKDIVFESNLVSTVIVPVEVDFHKSRDEAQIVKFIEDSNEELSNENSDVRIMSLNLSKITHLCNNSNLLCAKRSCGS